MLKRKTYLFAVLFVIIAIAARFLSKMGFFPMPLNLLRGGIYFFLIASWGITVYVRVVQTQIRRYMLTVSGLLCFWLLVRTIKYYFAVSPIAVRGLWYLYYLPMLFVPLCAVFISLLLGKSEDFRLKKSKWWLIFPTLLFFLLVVTNDWHQFVFHFPQGTLWSDAEYSYGIGYFFVISWMLFCGILALGIMIARCRIPQEHKWLLLPFVPLIITILYSGLYISGVHWLRVIAGDMTVFECLTFIAAFECCMACRLIQTNVNYEKMFQICSLEMWISDTNYKILMESETCCQNKQEIPTEKMRASLSQPQMLSGGRRLCGSSLGDLNVFWTEDVKALLMAADELQMTKENLEGENVIMRQEYQVAQRKAKVKEQEEIYHAMQRETASQIREISKWIDSAKDEKDWMKVAIFGAYLKRRNNLLLNSAQTPWLKPEEILFTFRDTKENLELYGISCMIEVEVNSFIWGENLKRMYDLFEAVIECSLDSMSAIYAKVREVADGLSFMIKTDAKTDLYLFASKQTTVEFEDEEWQLVMHLAKGDEDSEKD